MQYKDNEIEVKKSSKHEYGWSKYNNVYVIWDEDYDTRILSFIDNYDGDNEKYKYDNLIACSEHKGSIMLMFYGFVPFEYAKGKSIDICGDSWYIEKSFYRNL